MVPSIKDAFQHLYSSILNAVLLGRTFIVDKVITKKSPLNLIPMDMIIPKPIAMYYELIADLILPNDDVICVNVPEGGIPKHQVSLEDTFIPPNSFDMVIVESHNAYECYVTSPCVTSRLIEATLQQNRDKTFGPWDPLPNSPIISVMFRQIGILLDIVMSGNSTMQDLMLFLGWFSPISMICWGVYNGVQNWLYKSPLIWKN